MQHPELPIFAFIAATLVLIPLPWHWRAGNVAIVAIIGWLFAVNLIYGVNSIVWADNVRNPSPVYCDISSKIVVGVSYALPICTMCICKHLEAVSSNRKVSYDLSDKRRRMIFESIMCFGIPLIFMALHYIVQGHRFDIIEGVGCQAALYISVQAILIVWLPQLLFSVATLIYAALALRNFIRRRLTFSAHLQNSNSALTPNRYIRLIAMAIMEMCWGSSLNAFNMYNNISPGLRPWISWADVHSNFSRVDAYPAAFIPPHYLKTLMILWWALPVSSFIFFLFFGFGEEAVKEYRKIGSWFRVKVLRQKPGKPTKASSLISSLPSFVRRSPNDASRTLHVELKTTETSGTDKRVPLSPTSAVSGVTINPTTPSKVVDVDEEKDEDGFTIETLSYYEQSTDAMPTPRDQEISISDTYELSHPHEDSVRQSIERNGTPGYHRPFSPPSIYPIAAPQPRRSEEGIIVTIQRQASVDHMV